MSEQDRYGYDSASHPSHGETRRRGRWEGWMIVVSPALAFLGLLALLALCGCISLPSTPPQPPTTTTTLPAPPPTTLPPSPHPCADCLAQGYPLCNQPPEYLKEGCCNQPPGQDCYPIPPATQPPPVTSPPVTQPPSTQPPAPPASPGNCEIPLPDYAVKVTTPEKIVGPKQEIAPGVWVAVSSCPQDHCTAAELDILAPGVNPKYIEELRTEECSGGPCFCYGLGSHVITSTYKGMLSDGDLENLAERGAIDAYGRRVKTSDGGRSWFLVAHRGEGNVLLSPPAYSYTYGGFCPNLIEQACAEAEPPPPPGPTPAPPPAVEGLGITIAIRCAGTSPNCGVNETTGPEVNTGRVFRAPLKATSQAFHIDASYFVNKRGNKVHYFPPDDPSYDPRWPGPLVSWTEEILFGDHVDTSDFHDHPQGMTITARGIRYAQGDDPGYRHGTRNRWTACNAQGLCGSVTLEVLP